MSSSERKKGKFSKVWDTVMNWIARSHGPPPQQPHTYNNGQEILDITQPSPDLDRERTATAGTSSQGRKRYDRYDGNRRRTGRRATVVERLGERVTKLERLLQDTTMKLTSVATKADSIERLKIKIIDLDELVQGRMSESSVGSPRTPTRKARDIGFLTGKVIELNHLLHEKTDQLFDAEHIAREQIARKEADIEQLEIEVTQLNLLLREKIAEQTSAERVATEQIEKQKREIERLETEVARLNGEQSTKIPLEAEWEFIHRDPLVLDQEQHKEQGTGITSPPSTTEAGLRSPTVVRKADTISVAEVADLVRILNSQIEQTSTLITDSLSFRELPFSSEESQNVLNELTDYIGPWLCNDLRSKSNEYDIEPDPLITQLALQTGLVNACSYVINYGVAPADGAALSLHATMAEAGQAVSDTWKERTLARTYSIKSQRESYEIDRKYLVGIARKLITAVGGSVESGGSLPPQYNEKLEDIVRKALELHKIVSRDVVSTKLVTYTIPCDAEFDPSRMDDTDGIGDRTRHVTRDRVICTTEMGLQYRKKGSKAQEEWGVTMKAKVFLASTLET